MRSFIWNRFQEDPTNFIVPIFIFLQGDQAQMENSKSLVFLHANIEWFEIFFLWKNINWRFLNQNFKGLGQRFCLPHNFEHTANFHSKCKFCKYRVIKLKWKIVKAWYSLMPIFRDLKIFLFKRTLIDVFVSKFQRSRSKILSST